MHGRPTNLRRTRLALAAIILCAACGRDAAKLVASPSPQPASISLDSAAVHLTVGATHQFTAIVMSTEGGVLENAPVSWNSTNASIATVTQTGFVRGVTASLATITAVSGPHIATATVSVVDAPPATRIALTPALSRHAP